MKTILPQNTILSRANTVTVDAEKFAELNNLTDIELRQKLGDVMARFVKTYLAHVIKNNPDFTVGQALQVINMAADDLRAFTGVEIEAVDEYHPDMFGPEETTSDVQPEEPLPPPANETGEEEPQPLSDDDRRTRLFNSFGHKRIKTR